MAQPSPFPPRLNPNPRLLTLTQDSLKIPTQDSLTPEPRNPSLPGQERGDVMEDIDGVAVTELLQRQGVGLDHVNDLTQGPQGSWVALGFRRGDTLTRSE